ncbi:hypothetical protein M407DRAFT_144304 [Tulasnella calospora MUT 4182]|uniref:Uncharacterized protein n=1 Tax=Tulasnella calospora MUT 4182 TaxID=1051891 RepID=A0A0C3QGW5_9AGAM|nr:hypothetical protein M407DRAFT_144304 [Tulasnella calospora MUT 4182]
MDHLVAHYLLTHAYEQDLRQQTAAGFIIIAAVQAVQERIARANLRRLYLTRADRLPNPREGTPWTQLFHSRNDRAFITTMGFDVRCFFLILDSGFAAQWGRRLDVDGGEVRVLGSVVECSAQKSSVRGVGGLTLRAKCRGGS